MVEPAEGMAELDLFFRIHSILNEKPLTNKGSNLEATTTSATVT